MAKIEDYVKRIMIILRIEIDVLIRISADSWPQDPSDLKALHLLKGEESFDLIALETILLPQCCSG